MSKDKLARLGWRRPLKAPRRQPDSIELCTRVLLRTELCVLEQQNVSVTIRIADEKSLLLGVNVFLCVEIVVLS